jgi:hypothetical protein
MTEKESHLRGCAPPRDARALAAAHAHAVHVVCIGEARGIRAGGYRGADSILQLLQVLVVRRELLPQVLGKHPEVGAEVQKNLKLLVDEYTGGARYCCCCRCTCCWVFVANGTPGHAQQGSEVGLQLDDARLEEGRRHAEQRQRSASEDEDLRSGG